MDEQAYRQAEQRLWHAVGVQPRERRVRLERLDTDVRVLDVGEGPPVLYLHGGPNAGTTWAPIVGQLEGMRSLVVDRPGTGLSGPFPIDADNLTDVADAFVAGVLDALEVPAAHVVASSFGGFLALRSAAATPSRVDRMVQMGCPAGAPGMSMPGFMKALVTPGLGRVLQALPPSRMSVRMMLRQIGHDVGATSGTIAAFVDWYLALQRHTDTGDNEGRMIRQLASRRGWHPTLSLPDDVLAAVQAPTFFLWGTNDTFGGSDVAQRVVGRMPDAEVELLPGAGHLPWLDDPERAATATATFLSQPAPLRTAEPRT